MNAKIMIKFQIRIVGVNVIIIVVVTVVVFNLQEYS